VGRKPPDRERGDFSRARAGGRPGACGAQRRGALCAGPGGKEMTSGPRSFFRRDVFRGEKTAAAAEPHGMGRARERPPGLSGSAERALRCVGEDTTPDAHAAEFAAARYRGEVCCGVAEKFRAGELSAAFAGAA